MKILRGLDAAKRGVRVLQSIIIVVLSCCVLGWYITAILFVDSLAPSLDRPGEIEIVVPLEGEVVIGRAELGQPRARDTAALDHIALRQSDTGDAVLIRRVTDQRRLSLGFGDTDSNGASDRVALPWRNPDEPATAKDRLQLAVSGHVIELFVTQDLELAIDVYEDAVAAIDLSLEQPLQLGNLVSSHRIDANRQVLNSGQQTIFCAPWSDLNVLDRLSSLLARMKQTSTVLFGSLSEVAIIGGNETCMLHTRENMIPLPLTDPRVEFALAWYVGSPTATVTPRQISGGTSVAFVRIETGKVAFRHAGARAFEWPLANVPLPIADARTPHGQELRTEHEAKAEEVVRFIAGRTSYTAEVFEGPDANRHVLLTVGPHADGTLRNSDFCTVPEASVLGIDTCPEPRVGKPVDYISVSLDTPIDRLFRTVLTSHLSGLEKIFWIVMAGLGVILAFRSLRSRLRGRNFLVRALSYIVFAAFTALAAAPLGAALLAVTFELQVNGISMLALNTALLFVASIAIAFDPDGGLMSGAFWIALLMLVLLGAISLFDLSSGGFNTGVERYFVKHQLFALTLLPIFVIFVVLTPARDFRLALGADVTGRMNLRSPLLWLFSLTFIGFFLWLIVGGQGGVQGLQPVEFGKFMVVVGLSAILAVWLISQRLLGETRFGLSWFAIAVVFLLAVFVPIVPIARSDYSPLIIMIGASAIVISVMVPATGLRILRESETDSRLLSLVPVRYRSPMRLESRLRRRLRVRFSRKIEATGPKMRLATMAIVSISLLLLPIFWVARDLPVRVEPFGVPEWSWTDDRDTQLAKLESTLGEGRRLVKERLMIWVDLFMLPQEDGSEPARVQLPDLGFQVMRSRAAISNARCGLEPALTFGGFFSGPSKSGGVDAPNCRQAEDALLGACWLEGVGLCMAQPASEREVPTIDCRTADLKLPVAAHCIPVVESDFAVTYLLAEFGLGAGVLLIVLQGAILVLALMTVFRLLRSAAPAPLKSEKQKLRILADDVLEITSMPRDPIVAAGGLAMAALVMGAAAMYLMQWLLAWSNSMGLLPVMGQPMTWLSAATSHHVFFAIPCALVILLGIRGVDTRSSTVKFKWVPYK